MKSDEEIGTECRNQPNPEMTRALFITCRATDSALDGHCEVSHGRRGIERSTKAVCLFLTCAIGLLTVFSSRADELDYPHPLVAKNTGSIGAAELYWLLNQVSWQGDDLAVQMLLKAGADPDGVSDYSPQGHQRGSLGW